MPSPGFALRRNTTCLPHPTQTDCGNKARGFKGCYPFGYECPEQYNIACCPLGVNCTAELLKEPKCADDRWDLYDNGGYFCCERGTLGFDTGGMDGCAERGYRFREGEIPISIVRQGVAPTENASVQYVASRSMSGGVIVGAVVGPVAVVMILAVLRFWWMRRQRLNQSRHITTVGYFGGEVQRRKKISEVDGRTLYEADASPVHEIGVEGVSKHKKTAELP